MNRTLLFALALAATAAQAEIHKCRQGERLVYQEQPCPGSSLALTPPDPAPAPTAFQVEQARERAKLEIAEAEALWKRDAKAARTQEKVIADARRRENDCARLRDRIDKAEVKGSSSKKSSSDRRRYRKECGPL